MTEFFREIFFIEIDIEMNYTDKRKKILLLGNSYLVIFKFRRELIQKLIADGYDVVVCFPNGPFGRGEEASQQYGCRFIKIEIDRRGTNPLKDVFLIKDYYSIIKKEKPDFVLAYTVKPDVYGGLVCRLLKVPFIPNITGLGKALDEKSLVQKLTIWLYKIAVAKAKCVFFQNDSDRAFFDNEGIRYNNGITLPGSGVNLDLFQPLPYPPEEEPVRFIYVARVMKAKGIEEFFEAAHLVKAKYPDTEFHICGFCEEDYRKILEYKSSLGEVIYHGLVDNVTDYERICHCVVLPSFHPEGISNVLLEGAASARPLITTDHSGCKETVEDGITGFIVRQRDGKDLADKMLRFIAMPNAKRKEMGLLGRKKVEKEFNRQIVVNAYIKVINAYLN